MINKDELLNLILDCRNDPDHEFISKIEDFIAKSIPYNHSAKNIKKACGIPEYAFDLSKIDQTKEFESKLEMIEITEKMLTKRELAAIVAMMVPQKLATHG